MLHCDIACTTKLLIGGCANEYGQRAAHFIKNYTNEQVRFNWMIHFINDLINGGNLSLCLSNTFFHLTSNH